MCQSGIDLHGLMLAVEQLSGREAALRQDVQAWANYLEEQGVPEAAADFGTAIDNLVRVSEALASVQHQLHHLHDHGDDHHHDHTITATSFA